MDYPFHYDAHGKNFKNAQFLRKVETDAEALLWLCLRNRRMTGFKFRRQHPLANYILDFYCHELQLAIEVDGRIHQLPQNAAYDKERTAQLNVLGIQVIRFTNEQILSDINEVLKDLRRHCANREVPPLSASERGRG